MKIADLRAMSEPELIAAHAAKWNVAEGSAFYLDELRRREAKRAEDASYELATQSQNLAKSVYWLTIVNAVFAGLAAVVAIVALFLR